MIVLRPIIILVLVCNSLMAQEVNQVSASTYYQRFTHYNAEDYTGNAASFFESLESEIGITSDDEFKLQSVSEGLNGFSHYRYNQYHKGIRIFGAGYVIHESAGSVRSANGKILPQIDIDIKPSLTPVQAITYAQNDMQAAIYAWEIHYPINVNKKKRPQPELVIVDKSVTSFTGLYKLAYAFDLHSERPFKAYTYLIDAHTGEVIKKINKHHSHAVPGKGLTKYYGERDIIVDSISPSEFVLHDSTRGENGISITNSNYEVFTNESKYFDLTNELQDEVALDAMYLTSTLYDELKEAFDWLGLDNEDGSLNVIVHARGGEDLVNAFWDGEHAHFGDGDCNHGPLTTHEILAHEFMHGIIDNTSNLIYADEPGAINESLSDILGQYMEWVKDRENFSWAFGNSFQNEEGLTPLRVMDDPNAVRNPAYYKGLYWLDGGYVHSNSAVGNLFFVLLSEGGEVEANGEIYSIDGIGIEEAAKFLFFTNRHYLTRSSDYNDYYNLSLLAAEEYFGEDPVLIENLKNAWGAVGLPNQNVEEAFYKISLSLNEVQEICGISSYASLELTIENEGKLPYLADLGGVISISKDREIITTVPLDIDIMSGEVATIQVDSILRIDDSGVSLQVNLLYIPDNRGKTIGWVEIPVLEHVDNDLSLGMEFNASTCFVEKIDVNFNVTNQSCISVEAGSQFEIILTNQHHEVLFHESIVLDKVLLPEETIEYIRMLDLEVVNSITAEAKLIYPNDPNTVNNMASEVIQYLSPMKIGYKNEFTNEAELTQKLSIVNLRDNRLTAYQDNTVFFTSNYNQVVNDEMCRLPERYFIENTLNGTLTAVIKGCIEADESVLSFDLIQFRNENHEFVSDKTAGLQLILKENDDIILSDIIIGQPEGERINHQYNLPAFKGEIEMRFVTQSGNISPTFDMLDFDVVMLDNLSLMNTISTSDYKQPKEISIYPNPTTGVINIEQSSDFTDVVISTAQGIPIIKQPIATSQIDISILDAGFYILTAVDKDDHEHQVVFIKID